MQHNSDRLISIIIAVKDIKIHLLDRALASVAAIMQNIPLEVIVVNSDDSMDKEFWVHRYPFLSILDTPPEGVYPAFNAGISKARGQYVYFIGSDDILLPGMASLLAELSHSKRQPHVAIGRIFDEAAGIVRPFPNPLGLIIKNWHHQGMLFRRDVFDKYRFDCRYPIQADHFLNLQLSSNKHIKIKFFPQVLSFFSHGGISTTRIDWRFREDMPGHVGELFGPFWGAIAWSRRCVGTLRRKVWRPR